MAQFSQLGRPKSFETTTPALKIEDLLEMEVTLDHEAHKHFGNNRFPRKTIGNDATRIRIKTTDVRVVANYHKSKEVAGITCTWEGTASTIDENGDVTVNPGTYTFECTVGSVAEAVKITPAADGKPAEFEVTFEPAIKESDGTAPTVGLTFSPGSGDSGGGGGEGV